jgi:competence protein ComEC
MFSFIIIGNNVSKSSDGINALFGAGCMMLSIEPDTLYDVGFQLSFSAVLSILLFYNSIRKLVYTKNPLLQKGWSFVALSISVQILTLPLLIFHFQQYPTYSILNNLLIVPLSSIVLIAELLLFIHPIHEFNTFISSQVITTCIQWMNSYATVMNALPFRLVSFPVMSIQMILLQSISILGLFFYFLKKQPHLLWMTLTVATMGFIQTLIEHIHVEKLHRLIVLNMRDVGTIIHQHGNKADIYVFGNGKTITEKDMLRIKSIAKHTNIAQMQFKKINMQPMVLQNRRTDTAIIMMANNLYDAETRLLLSNHKNWLADGSTKLWKISRWRKDPQNLHLRLLHTAETGPIYLACKDYHRFFRQN